MMQDATVEGWSVDETNEWRRMEMYAAMEGWSMSMDGAKERRRMNGRRGKGSALTSVPDAALNVRTKSTGEGERMVWANNKIVLLICSSKEVSGK